ncbi:MAG: 16S rRNA (uracil(1498)-N(3))-methyltransferase [Bacillota bacterium]
MSHWFFVDEEGIGAEEVWLSPEDSHHLVRVLRARPGEAFTAVAGGVAYRCELVETRGPQARGRILSREPVRSEPPVHITVFQGLPKGEKLEQVLQHGTEIGVSAFVPVACARSVVKLDPEKAAARRVRWQKVVREAAQQARRGAIPEAHPLHTWAEAVRRVPEFDLALVLWEQEAGRPGLRQRLAGVRPGARVAVFVGPEGGLTEAEVAAAVAAGAHPVGLGPRILRTETAALAAVAAILYAVGDLGGEPDG